MNQYDAYVAGTHYSIQAADRAQARQKAKSEHMVKTGYLPVGSRVKVTEAACNCMTEDDHGTERVLTHSMTCHLHPEA